MMDENKNEMDRLFRKMPFAIMVLDVKNFVVDIANDKTLELWNKRRDQVEGKNVFDIFPEFAKQGFHKILEDVYLSGKPYKPNEVSLRLIKNGSLSNVFVNFGFEPLLGEGNKILKIIGLGVEISDHVQTRQKIVEAEIRSRLAIDAGKMGTFDWDFLNKVFISSPRLLEIFGFGGKKNISHQDLISTFHPDDRPIREQAVENSFTSGSLLYEIRIFWSDRSIHWIRVHGKVTYNDQHQPVKMYGLVTDITEEQKSREQLLSATEELTAMNEELAATNEELSASNEELAESNKLLYRTNADLDNFIYTASHDLKAPVSNLEGLFNTLLGEIDLKPELNHLKEMIDASFIRFKKTVYELTEITKLQKEGQQEYEWVNLEEILKDATFGIQDYINQTKAEIMIDFQIPQIRFSVKNLRSIVYNLVFNAIKYRDPQKRPLIKVSSYLQEGYTVLKISDNGLGLSKENITKIFGMFKRVHDHVEGTGIGLYIVKKIVDNASGKIEVESQVGKGSSFMVYLRSNH